jgi:hypothetical protein
MPGPGSVAFSKLDQSGGKSRRQAKADKRAEEAAELKSCYRIVDARDGGRCRVCNRRASPQATTLLDRMHRHHMVYRSRGGQHESSNVVSLCAACHSAIHVEMVLRVDGDATARDAVTGALAGVQVSRYTETGWKVEKWV